MKVPLSARYDKVLNKATNFLLDENIYEFPLNARSIIYRHKNWKITPYSKIKNNPLYKELLDGITIKDSIVVEYLNRYIIIYNDILSPFRIYFTVFHEIGHIILGHLTDFPSLDSLTDEEYTVLENEANSFARNVVSPITLVLELQMNLSDIKTIFCISSPAAKTRAELSKSDHYWISAIDYDIQLNSLAGFYRQAFAYLKQQKKMLGEYYTHHCPLCGNKNIVEDTGLCLSCSLNNLPDFKDMYTNYITREILAGATPPF